MKSEMDNHSGKNNDTITVNNKCNSDNDNLKQL